MSKKTILAALAALAAACGGSGTERTTKNFSYGPGTQQSVSAVSVASGVESGVGDAVDLHASSDGSVAALAGSRVAVLPFSMMGALDATAAALPRVALATPNPTERAALTAASQLVAATGTIAAGNCWTATPTSVTYTNCSLSAMDTGGSFDMTLNGTVSKVGADEAKWDLAMKMSGSGTGGSFSMDVHAFGDVTVTATSVDGFAECDVKVTAAGTNGGTATASATASVDFEKVTRDAAGCVADGTVELKRIGSYSATSGTGSASASQDSAVKLTWQGCGTVLVQHSI